MGYSSRSHSSLISSQNRLKNVDSHRHKSSQSSDENRSSSNMKCILTIGIILPIVAAIIGVVAWAVTSESSNKSSTFEYDHPRRSYQGYSSNFHRGYSPILEDRNDLLLDDQKVAIGSSVSKDILGEEVMLEEDPNHSLTSADTSSPKNDPLYVVHYVPQDIDVPKSTAKPAVQTSSSEHVLSKILSAAKNKNQRTPQFVVFAPNLGEHTRAFNNDHVGGIPENGYESEERIGSNIKTVRGRKKHRTRIVAEEKRENYEEHNFPENQPILSPSATNPSQIRAEVVPRAGRQYYNDPNSDYSVQHEQQHWNQQMPPQHNQHMQHPYQGMMHNIQNQMMGQYPPHSYKQGGWGPHCCPPDPPPETTSTTEAPPQGGPGISISLGNGAAIPIGPLGILRTILGPFLPSPKMDFRKKIFFGVQLENGMQLGAGNSTSNPRTIMISGKK